MVNSSIEYSGLLITRTFHRYKHQLRDFFNRHRRLRSLRGFELAMGLRPTHWDENWVESVRVRSIQRGRQRSFALWMKCGRF